VTFFFFLATDAGARTGTVKRLLTSATAVRRLRREAKRRIRRRSGHFPSSRSSIMSSTAHHWRHFPSSHVVPLGQQLRERPVPLHEVVAARHGVLPAGHAATWLQTTGSKNCVSL
jgi:hypothetical protein